MTWVNPPGVISKCSGSSKCVIVHQAFWLNTHCQRTRKNNVEEMLHDRSESHHIAYSTQPPSTTLKTGLVDATNDRGEYPGDSPLGMGGMEYVCYSSHIKALFIFCLSSSLHLLGYFYTKSLMGSIYKGHRCWVKGRCSLVQ